MTIFPYHLRAASLIGIMDTNAEHTKAKAYIGSEATQLLKY